MDEINLLTWQVQVTGAAAPPARAPAQTPAVKSQLLCDLGARSLGVVLLRLLGPGAAASGRRVRQVQDVPHGETGLCAGGVGHDAGGDRDRLRRMRSSSSRGLMSAEVQQVTERSSAEPLRPWSVKWSRSAELRAGPSGEDLTAWKIHESVSSVLLTTRVCVCVEAGPGSQEDDEGVKKKKRTRSGWMFNDGGSNRNKRAHLHLLDTDDPLPVSPQTHALFMHSLYYIINSLYYWYFIGLVHI